MYYPKHHQVFPKPQTMNDTENLHDAVADYREKHPFLFHEGVLNTSPPPMVSYELQFQLLHPDSKLPTRATDGSAGLDLYCHSSNPYGKSMVEYDTGVAVAIPEGYVGLVVPRSSITGTALRLANSVGVIDCDYRGPIKLRFDFNHEAMPDASRPYQHGDRIGQLLIIPAPIFTPTAVESLPLTTRGEGGFGSTGV